MEAHFSYTVAIKKEQYLTLAVSNALETQIGAFDAPRGGRQIFLIDAHMHLFEQVHSYSARGEGRLIGNGEMRLGNGDAVRLAPIELGGDLFLAETAVRLMDESGVAASVLMQSGFYGFQNEYYAEVAARYPGRFFPAAAYDPFCLRGEELRERLIDRGAYVAFKFELSEGYGLAGVHPCLEPDGAELTEAGLRAGETRMAIALDVGQPGERAFRVDALKRLTRACRETRFVFCHLLAPQRDRLAWLDDMRALDAENVFFDLAAIQFNLPENDLPARYLADAIDRVGRGRLLWGSDAPGTVRLDRYENLAGYIRASGLSSGVADDILRKNARIAYDIDYWSKADQARASARAADCWNRSINDPL